MLVVLFFCTLNLIEVGVCIVVMFVWRVFKYEILGKSRCGSLIAIGVKTLHSINQNPDVLREQVTCNLPTVSSACSTQQHVATGSYASSGHSLYLLHSA